MKKSKNSRRILRAVFLFALFLLFTAVSYYVVRGAHFFSTIREPGEGTVIEDEPEIPRRPEEPEYTRTNILLLGVDALSTKDRGRTDSIMVMSFDERSKDASLLSIPRDSRVNIPGRKVDKINHAYAFGGVSLTVKTVEEFLDIPIHYYVLINFEGFEKIVDTLGGVTIDVEKHVAANRPELKAGLHHLNGGQALMYVRDRSDSDIGRAKRQQKLIKAVAQESLGMKAIIRGPELLNTLGNNLRTNMPALDMVGVATRVLQIDLDEIAQGVIPGKGEYINGVSYWIPDISKTNALLEDLGLRPQQAAQPAES